jgi:alkylhydroperoxidase family enzyme
MSHDPEQTFAMMAEDGAGGRQDNPRPAGKTADRSAGSAARLRPIPVRELGEEARAVLRGNFRGAADRFLSEGPDAVRMPNVLSTLMHHPKLAGPWLAYNGVLLNAPAIEPRLRELMVLRVAWRARSRYEWVQHVRLAKQLGITAAQIDAIAGLSSDAAWTPLEAELLAATDQLIDRYRIDDATWSRLAQQLDERQLVEVVFLVGSYVCLAMAFNSFGIELDPELYDVDAPAMPEPEDP